MFRTKAESPTNESNTWIYIAVGAGGAAFVMIIFIFIWRIKRRPKSPEPEIPLYPVESARTPKKPKPLYKYVNMSQQDEQAIYDEYQELERCHLSCTRSNGDVEYADYDRYRNIFARGSWNQTAVQLIGAHRFSDYINANHIKGYDNKKQYIACQGPLKDTCEDFWDMIYQFRVRKIIMLTHCDQRTQCESKSKCFPYFPARKNERLSFDRWTVTTQKVLYQRELDLRIRYIHLKGINRNHGEHSVIHYGFTGWKDFKAIEPSTLLELIDTINNHDPAGERDNEPPEVVHCSAGVGRTGTYIAVDTIVRMLDDQPNDLQTMELDVMSIVYHLRKDRMKMVQTYAQYMLVNHCVEEYLRRTNQLGLVVRRFSDDDDHYINSSVLTKQGTARSHYSNLSERKYSTQRSVSTIGTQRPRRQSNLSGHEDRSIRRNHEDIHLPPIPPQRSISIQNSSDY